MIGVAFEAARFGVVRAGCMAGLAGFDSGHQQVTGIGAAQRFFVATHASKASVGLVVELCMGHPAGSDADFGNVRQHVFVWRRGLLYVRQFAISIERELVALQAGLAP